MARRRGRGHTMMYRPLAAALLSLAAMLPAASLAVAADDRGTGDGRIRVQLMSRHAVTLSSEIPAKIASLPVVEGAAFQKGQVLVEFDCTSYRAQLRKAQASMEAAAEL